MTGHEPSTGGGDTPGLSTGRSASSLLRRPGPAGSLTQAGRTGRPAPDQGGTMTRPTTTTTRRTTRTKEDRGITTAEYAVGTAAGAGLAGLLYKLLTGGFGDRMLRNLFDHVFGLLGIG